MMYSSHIRLPFSLGEGYPDPVWVPVIRSRRKTVSLSLKPDGTFLVRGPLRIPDKEVTALLAQKEGWLRSHLAKQRDAADADEAGRLTEEEIDALIREARTDIPARVKRFGPAVGVSWGRISIRKQRTRWGSCSAEGNLSFNGLLMLAPPEARDYVVIHELCHRLEMNHSARFWAHVERVCPDYKVQKKWFREHGPALMKRMFG
ncbi:MAG: M48 family metallopeptidase [Clostridiales bacterium]|nr:M48 family metallopeptidase [Clostridiales bacterium]